MIPPTLHANLSATLSTGTRHRVRAWRRVFVGKMRIILHRFFLGDGFSLNYASVFVGSGGWGVGDP